MIKVKVEVKGITPLLMYRHPGELAVPEEKMSREKRAELHAYRIPGSRELYIPAEAFRASIVGAAVFSNWRRQLTLQRIVAPSVSISPEYLGLGIEEYEIDERWGVNRSTRGRIRVIGPRIPTWGFTAMLDYDEILLSEAQIRKVVDDAGRLVGLLRWRPAKKGPYGRFIVIRWKII